MRFLVAIPLLLAVGCSKLSDALPGGLQPAPVQEAVAVTNIPVEGSVKREEAQPLESVNSFTIARDETDTGTAQLLGDGTLYRLELDRLGKTGAALLRFDNVANGASEPVRIPLIAPPGQTIRADTGFGLGLRVATSSPGVQMNRNGFGTVWWEEDGPRGRLIEFRIEGDKATMVPPGAATDDPKKPVARRFNLETDREVAFRFTSGAVHLGSDTQRANLGGRGFSVGLSRIGSERTEAFLESPAFDIPNVDVLEYESGELTITIGYIKGDESGHATQVTYDPGARKWKDHRPLVVFPKAQTVEVADVGEHGVLVNLIRAWNGNHGETGLYWTRPDQPVRFLVQRIRNLKAVLVDDGFVAVFEDEFKSDIEPENQNDIYVLRARDEKLTLHRFVRPGPASTKHFVWLGGNRFVATFGNDRVVAFEVP